MINLTTDELKDILEAFRFIQESPSWRNGYGWNDELYAKIQNIIDPPKKCCICGALETYWDKSKSCEHDYQPASVSQWGHQFNQCVICGEVG